MRRNWWMECAVSMALLEQLGVIPQLLVSYSESQDRMAIQ